MPTIPPIPSSAPRPTAFSPQSRLSAEVFQQEEGENQRSVHGNAIDDIRFSESLEAANNRSSVDLSEFVYIGHVPEDAEESRAQELRRPEGASEAGHTIQPLLSPAAQLRPPPHIAREVEGNSEAGLATGPLPSTTQFHRPRPLKLVKPMPGIKASEHGDFEGMVEEASVTGPLPFRTQYQNPRRVEEGGEASKSQKGKEIEGDSEGPILYPTVYKPPPPPPKDKPAGKSTR